METLAKRSPCRGTTPAPLGPGVSRRAVIGGGTAGMLSAMLPRLAAAASKTPRRRGCIILWMGGGPSQIDTFDMKPGHENGGAFKEIQTNVPGIRWSEHLPRLATMADQLSITRTLHSREGDHERGSYFVRTGQKMGGPFKPPELRSLIGQQLAPERSALPPLVATGDASFFGGGDIGPGFLGPRYQPLDVSVSRPGAARGDDLHAGTTADLRVDAVERAAGIDPARWNRRGQLLDLVGRSFHQSRPLDSLAAHRVTYENAKALMEGDAAKAFDLSGESSELRRRYGVGSFGQGCLLARRLIEAGVACVEVSLRRSTIGGFTWDSHAQNFDAVAALSRELDAGFATLIEDLRDRGLLETTTVVCMGEFGRTPGINAVAGRDHFPSAFFGVLAGGSTAGGTVHGATTDNGLRIASDPVTVPQWLATICAATGIDPADTVTNESGRPVPIVDATPVWDVIA